MSEFASDASPYPGAGLPARRVYPTNATPAGTAASQIQRGPLRRMGSAVAMLALSLGLAFLGMTLVSTPAEAAVTVPSAAENWPVLRYNSSGPAVQYVQKRLHQVSDGWFGPQTKKAVNTYKRNHHLNVDGVVGRRVWAGLGVPHRVKAGPHLWPVLRVNSYGPAVTYVKKRLHINASNNWFGSGTMRAVNQFKQKHHLRSDGVVGNGVWKALGVRYVKPAAPKKASNGIPKSVQALNWSALARCESGGNPRAVNSAGYYGLYQFSLRTWRAVGGRGNPVDASRSQQTYRGQVLYVRAGAGQWPVCGRHLFG